MSKYCFHTSAFLEAWVRHYPIEVFHTLWARLDEAIASGDIVSPDEVLVELGKKEDGIAEWIRQRDQFIQPLSPELQAAVSGVLARFPRLVDSEKSRSQGDPFVIGLAMITGSAVVSEEKPSYNVNKPKIPDVCTDLGIRCLLLIDFIREQGWHF